jgi:hypothetical protein
MWFGRGSNSEVPGSSFAFWRDGEVIGPCGALNFIYHLPPLPELVFGGMTLPLHPEYFCWWLEPRFARPDSRGRLSPRDSGKEYGL